MERNSDCKVQLIDYVCDKCEKGIMKYNDKIYFTFPEQYEHKCNSCGVIRSFQAKYPKISYTYMD